MTGPTEDDGRMERLTTAGTFTRATARIREDPLLLVPFALAGFVLAVLDWLRLQDPVPTLEGRAIDATGIEISLEFVGYPTGTPGTARRVSALVDLEAPYLLWALGLEVLAVLAVAAAGWYTIVRTTSVEPTRAGFGSYLGLVVLFGTTFRLLSSVGDVGPLGPAGFLLALAVLAVIVLFVFARLFVAPALAALGNPPWTAIRRSIALSGGHELALAGLIVGFGLATWLLGIAPYVGVFVSSVVVAAVHAVTTVVALESIVGDQM